jgi:hypothetical protein
MKICAKCKKRSVRISPSARSDIANNAGIIWCMGCASQAGILRNGDYDPESEPEGFPEFVEIVIGGPV